jgi:hypothetical protein
MLSLEGRVVPEAVATSGRKILKKPLAAAANAAHQLRAHAGQPRGDVPVRSGGSQLYRLTDGREDIVGHRVMHHVADPGNLPE